MNILHDDEANLKSFTKSANRSGDTKTVAKRRRRDRGPPGYGRSCHGCATPPRERPARRSEDGARFEGRGKAGEAAEQQEDKQQEESGSSEDDTDEEDENIPIFIMYKLEVWTVQSTNADVNFIFFCVCF